MYSGGEYWCNYQWFRERSDSLWQSHVPIHLELFREHLWDIGTTPLHVCQVGEKFACFCSLAISRPGDTNWHVFLYIYWTGLLVHKSCLRLMACVSVTSSGDSPWRGLEWDVPLVYNPVVHVHGQLSSSVSPRSFSHTAGQDQPPHSWPAHPGRGL